MESIKEDLQILISHNESPIKENIYTVKLNENGTADLQTEKINGYLKSIFVEIGEIQNLNVIIFLVNHPYVKIIDAAIKKDTLFNPMMVDTGPHGTEYTEPSRREWVLNDELGIYLEGPQNSEVKVIMRYG